MRRFLKQYWSRTPEQLQVGTASAVCGEVAFKEELHAKNWDSCFMAVCPQEPQQVDGGVPCWALVIFQTKRQRNGAKATAVRDVKPLRYCDVAEVGQGDGNVKLPKSVTRGFILTLSSQHPEFVADEFAFCLPKKASSTEAKWQSVLKRVPGDAVTLKTGQLSLRGQKKKAHSETAYQFVLKGPTLSYYDAAQKRLGSISFEDPNTDIDTHEDEEDIFEVISPKGLYRLRAKSLEDRAAWITAMQDVKQRINCSEKEPDSDSDEDSSADEAPEGHQHQAVASVAGPELEPEPEPEPELEPKLQPARFDVHGRITCVGGHELKGFVTADAGYNCDNCLKEPLPIGTKLWGCQICGTYSGHPSRASEVFCPFTLTCVCNWLQIGTSVKTVGIDVSPRLVGGLVLIWKPKLLSWHGVRGSFMSRKLSGTLSQL
jgi:hypothetical protein